MNLRNIIGSALDAYTGYGQKKLGHVFKKQGGWTAAAVAAVGAISSYAASSKQSSSAKKALKNTNALLGPYSDAGKAGLSDVQSFVDTGANFADTQAFKDITNSSKAGGQFQSGNRATALVDYYTNNFRTQRLNELMALPTLGANASAGQATNLGKQYGALGNAQAEGIYGMGLAAQNALGFLASYKGQQNPSGGGVNSGFGNQSYGTYGFNTVGQAYNPQGNINQSYNPDFNRSLFTGSGG